MPETCDEPGCTADPTITMNIFRAQPPGTIPHFASSYRDVCIIHSVFRAESPEDFVHIEPFSVLNAHRLWNVIKRLPEDYPPWGAYDPEALNVAWSDCSAGCKFFAQIRDQQGADFGVCGNPASHRAGLLTFEHQGCKHFESDPEEDD